MNCKTKFNTPIRLSKGNRLFTPISRSLKDNGQPIGRTVNKKCRCMKMIQMKNENENETGALRRKVLTAEPRVTVKTMKMKKLQLKGCTGRARGGKTQPTRHESER